MNVWINFFFLALFKVLKKITPKSETVKLFMDFVGSGCLPLLSRNSIGKSCWKEIRFNQVPATWGQGGLLSQRPPLQTGEEVAR